MLTTIPRGTKDILPGAVEDWLYLEGKIRDICRLYQFKEIRTPMFEHTELFLRGIGETTDVVEKEMYTFTDRGNRSITLRPENTASVVRAYLQNKLYGDGNVQKLFYIGSMFRYDKPQAGRYREFHQFGVEAIGEQDALIDAEVIAFAAHFLKSLGLKDVALKLNSVGCPTCRTAYRKRLQDFFRPKLEQLCDDCRSRFERNPLRILDCKNEKCQAASEGAPEIVDYLCDDCRTHFEKLQQYLKVAGVDFSLDARLVRGLDYYTKTAFEFKYEPLGAQSAILGGGRYDGLIEECGGKPTPAIGFATGLERVLLALEKQNLLPQKQESCDISLIALGEAARSYCFDMLNKLRQKGLCARMSYGDKSMRAQIKQADKSSSRLAVIIGDDELAKQIAIVRNMSDSEQKEVPLASLLEELSADK